MLALFRNVYKIASKNTKYISYKPGPPQNLYIDSRTIEVRPFELLVKVKAIGINRAECLHRAGKYKIDKPSQAFIGLEAAGEVIDPQTNQKLYDGIALLSGGSYAEWASVPSTHIMALPKNLSYAQGAAIPQAWLTALQLLRLAETKQGSNIVVYAGASGVGTAATQLVKILGANIYCVVSSEEKATICKELGAKGTVLYKNNPNWPKDLITLKGGLFDAVLDCVGEKNYQSTIQLLDIDGKWVLFGLLSGARTKLNLASLLAKRVNLISTTLKTRSDQYKNCLVDDFKKTALQKFYHQTLQPVIYKKMNCDWSSAEPFIEAHKMMESNMNSGKIIIQFK